MMDDYYAAFSARLDAEAAKKRKYHQQYYLANRGKYQERSRKQYAANPEGAKERHRRWDTENPERRIKLNRKSHLKRKYGLTQAEWEVMFEAQGRCCASCRATNSGSKQGWVTDHDHKTGDTRGILCHPCNVTLGHAKDNPAWLRALAGYLER